MNGLVMYPCPLGNERFARLYLPSDLTRSDVARIAAILWALAPAEYGPDQASIVDAAFDQAQTGTVAERDKQPSHDLGRVTP